ncbi:hypothetical protein DFJ73DRAFT_769857 [Zopfochytrium polystomum]|nr:hypothetical protein DFJ73DRAFT_769857 [Zopfochytrium polystomum]
MSALRPTESLSSAFPQSPNKRNWIFFAGAGAGKTGFGRQDGAGAADVPTAARQRRYDDFFGRRRPATSGIFGGALFAGIRRERRLRRRGDRGEWGRGAEGRRRGWIVGVGNRRRRGAAGLCGVGGGRFAQTLGGLVRTARSSPPPKQQPSPVTGFSSASSYTAPSAAALLPGSTNSSNTSNISNNPLSLQRLLTSVVDLVSPEHAEAAAASSGGGATAVGAAVQHGGDGPFVQWLGEVDAKAAQKGGEGTGGYRRCHGLGKRGGRWFGGRSSTSSSSSSGANGLGGLGGGFWIGAKGWEEERRVAAADVRSVWNGRQNEKKDHSRPLDSTKKITKKPLLMADGVGFNSVRKLAPNRHFKNVSSQAFQLSVFALVLVVEIAALSAQQMAEPVRCRRHTETFYNQKEPPPSL